MLNEVHHIMECAALFLPKVKSVEFLSARQDNPQGCFSSHRCTEFVKVCCVFEGVTALLPHSAAALRCGGGGGGERERRSAQ